MESKKRVEINEEIKSKVFLLKNNKVKQCEIAEILNISEGSVSNIILKKTEDGYLTPKEYCEKYSLCKNKVYRAIELGLLESKRNIGSNTRISVKDEKMSEESIAACKSENYMKKQKNIQVLQNCNSYETIFKNAIYEIRNICDRVLIEVLDMKEEAKNESI